MEPRERAGSGAGGQAVPLSRRRFSLQDSSVLRGQTLLEGLLTTWSMKTWSGACTRPQVGLGSMLRGTPEGPIRLLTSPEQQVWVMQVKKHRVHVPQSI